MPAKKKSKPKPRKIRSDKGQKRGSSTKVNDQRKVERSIVKQRADVRALEGQVQNLGKLQTSWLSKILKTNDAFEKTTDRAKALAKAHAESGKYTKKNNDLAENQTRVAKISLGYGQKQGFLGKYILQNELKKLKAKRKTQDFDDEITDSMIDQLEAQADSVSIAGQLNKALDSVDSAFGGMGGTIKGFLMNPLTAVVALLMAFNAQQEAIADTFGAMGVTEFREDLADASQEFVKLGYEGKEALTAIKGLSSEFGIGFSKANQMSDEVGELAKSTGTTLDDSTKLVGVLTATQGLSAEFAVELLKSAEALAIANDVAPSAVLKDVAANTEVFAKFSNQGAENILKAAIQAKKLGISLDVVAGSAESMMDFQSSLNAEVEASILLGRNLNLQKARELALTNDLAGLQEEILNVVGTQEEFNEMMLPQRMALAKALGMDITSLSKIVGKQKEQLTLAGALSNIDTSKLVSDDAITATAEMLNNIKAMGMKLAEDFAPQIEGIVKGLMTAVGWIVSMKDYLPLIIGMFVTLKGLSLALALQAAITSAFEGTKGIPFGWLIALAAIPGLIAMVMTWSAVGDLDSPAKGKTKVSTKEGGLFELSKNDDLLAGPGLSATMAGRNTPMTTTLNKTMQNASMMATPGGLGVTAIANLTKTMTGGGELAAEDKNNLLAQPTISAAISNVQEPPIVNIDTKKLEAQNSQIRNEMASLRSDMANYFGVGGSAIRGIGNKLGDRILSAT